MSSQCLPTTVYGPPCSLIEPTTIFLTFNWEHFSNPSSDSHEKKPYINSSKSPQSCQNFSSTNSYLSAEETNKFCTFVYRYKTMVYIRTPHDSIKPDSFLTLLSWWVNRRCTFLRKIVKRLCSHRFNEVSSCWILIRIEIGKWCS